MSAYSSVTIDGTDVQFDPDTLSVTTNNTVSINRSMGGTTYITSVKSNTTSYNRTVNIGGAILPATQAAALLVTSSKKTTVVVGGGIVGTSGNFIVLSVTLNPTKPRVDYPSNAEVKYSYTVALQEVDA